MKYFLKKARLLKIKYSKKFNIVKGLKFEQYFFEVNYYLKNRDDCFLNKDMNKFT